jgi:hypothetical protein
MASISHPCFIISLFNYQCERLHFRVRCRQFTSHDGPQVAYRHGVPVVAACGIHGPIGRIRLATSRHHNVRLESFGIFASIFSANSWDFFNFKLILTRL